MKFSINFDSINETKSLIYRVDESSYDMLPHINETNFHILINYIDLTVDENNHVVELRGYSPYESWIKSNCKAPILHQGILKVETLKEPGFSYRIDDKEWPVYFNVDEGWVCIGSPEKCENSVEFISNCIAVIDQGKLVSIWLKPKFTEPIVSLL